MDTLQNMIRTSVSMVTEHPNFKTWMKGRILNDGDLIAINNSFLYREKLKTTKSNKYIIVKYNLDESLKEMHIAKNIEIIKPEFLQISNEKLSEKSLSLINTAIEEELNSIGLVMFALIGSVQDDFVQSESFNRLGFSELIWDSKNKGPLTIDGSNITIQNPYDEQLLWDTLVQHCNRQKISIDESAKGIFGAALEKLQSNAEAKLELPKAKQEDFRSILDEIINSLQERRIVYTEALSVCKGKPEIDKDAFNEVLRIAYNFSNDVIPMLNLTIGICDLKPIVFWGTIGEHYLLSESICNLPWTPSFNKANLESYQNMVGNARNYTFHNLFPFQKALRLSLPSGSLENTELRFFAEYANRKKGNKLTYQDKELVDLFLDFTRAKQRFVPTNFWEKNVDVMDKVIDLFEATNRMLKELYRISLAK